MTLLTRYTQRVTGFSITIRNTRFCLCFKERCVTLQTARRHRTAEIERPVSVTRAIYPTRDFRPIRNRQLKKLVVFSPVEISLSLSPGANDEVESFGDVDRVGWCSEYARLEKAISFGFHAVLELALCSEDILAQC